MAGDTSLPTQYKQKVAAWSSGIRLLVAVVHDPSAHASLDQELDRFLEDRRQLGRLVESGFLLFRLSDPLDDWLDPQGTCLSFTNRRLDLDIAADLIVDAASAALGIEASRLPCLLVTTDLLGTGFTIIPTSAYAVLDRARRYGAIADPPGP